VDIPRRVDSLDAAAARVEAAFKAKLVTSYAALVDATDVAVDTLVNIAMHGRREEARVAAAKEILDRSGLSPEIRISVDTAGGERQARLDALRMKLNTMGDGLRAPLEVGEAADTA
jgi:ABC-type uncharacterized transport system YnjBCD ATPase subunit